MHHIKVKIFGRVACGWFIFSSLKNICVREVVFEIRMSDLMYQGSLNQAALAKLHVKNR
jgi:hypothetical protein